MGLGLYKQYKIENCKQKERWKFFSFYQFYYKKLGNENVLNISLNSITMWCEPRSLLPLIMSCHIKFFYKKEQKITHVFTFLFNKYIPILKTKTKKKKSPKQSARRRTTITTRDDVGVRSRVRNLMVLNGDGQKLQGN